MGFGKSAAACALLLVVCGCDRPEGRPEEAAGGAAAVASTQAVARAVARPAAAGAAKAVQPAKAAAGVPKAPPAVVGFSFHGGENISLEFNGTPDLARLMDFVKITPAPGPLTQDWWAWDQRCVLRGDFAPRTSYQLVVRAGLPMADGRVTAQEFRRAWRTGDRPKEVAFAAAGRYLPAGGLRAVGVKTMNVTNLCCRIRPVPLRNIVQLLAREEDCYERFYGGGGDSGDAAELAGAPVVRTLRVKGRLNEACTTPVEVRNDEGEAANGVYLVSASGEDDGTAWKLVCVTDIGLSVREAGGTVYVWATSLTQGRPLPNLRVLVYGANNAVLGEGLTDAEGWCSCELPAADAEPFAVVASRMDETDTSFLALRGEASEQQFVGARRDYVRADGTEAFLWTDRGIYRHREPILVHALLRNGKGNAPKPFPVALVLKDPEGKEVRRHTQMTDAFGAVARCDFTVADDQPSGLWEILVQTPGDNPVVLGSRDVKIEEFVPPQIRVKVTPPASRRATTNLVFSVSGEHLFGGPARGLPVEGAVMFEDAPFAPKGWEGFRFGDANRRIAPNFRKLEGARLDDAGQVRFAVDFPKGERPRAAVKMTVQGSVFESGGRPASARASCELHAYPFYIGVALPDAIRQSKRPRACRVALVGPDGAPHAGARRLTARFMRVDCVYELKKTASGFWEWQTDRVRYPMGEDVEVPVSATGVATLEVPAAVAGDCEVTLVDEETGVSFGAAYWVGGEADGTVRAALENPARVTLTPDKPLYHPGDRPRLTVKAPFAGCAWLSVLRDELVYSQVVTLTNATSEIVLEEVKAAWAPSVDVALSVVQAVQPGARHTANRAFGVTPLRVATRDSALDVKVRAEVACRPTGGSQVTVSVEARGEGAVGERAAVTIVDEGINMLTGEKVPDPSGWFGAARQAEHPLYDIFNRLLPILDERHRRAGAKTGGGAEGDLFRRVSPIPTRRFKPLSRWTLDVKLVDGRATVPFSLPEFVGEVRATAVAYNRRATGAGAVQAKVVPHLVMQPDAPRFAAPGDVFFATVTLNNRSGRSGTAVYDLLAGGAVGLDRPVHGEVALADGESRTFTIPVRAGKLPGAGTLVFVAEGFGEKHRSEIELPVRPAAPWAKTATAVCLQPGESKVYPNADGVLPEAARRTFLVSGSPVAELAPALEYLVGYPHGCLEQTVSRVYPLLAAGGILNTLPVAETTVAQDARVSVEEGVRRVCAMVRANDFSMWPDTTTAPWDPGVSLWAAEFLVEASKGGFAVPKDRLARVAGFLRGWAMSTNAATSVAACQTLARAGTPDRDRMLHWFDRRGTLEASARCRLARAFTQTGDRDRARELLDGVHAASVEETAAAVLALLDLDPADVRLPGLVASLAGGRLGSVGHWGTTARNARALLALAAYYRMHGATTEPPAVFLVRDGREEPLAPRRAWSQVGGGEIRIENRGKGPAFVSASRLALPDAAALPPESAGISISRRYLLVDGRAADLADLSRGELVFVETTLTSAAPATYSDLVLEELLPACFEPDQTPLAKAGGCPGLVSGVKDWELRRELRDDRVLAFSKRFSLPAGASATFVYAVRVVSMGDFALPGPSVEAMYDPAVHARGPARRVRISR